MGVDDFEWESAFELALTTIAQKFYKVGSMATDISFDRLGEERDGNKEVKEIRIPIG